jgi:hypothetical protein
LRAFDAAQHVLLRDVRDFVREHAGHLVLARRRQHEAGVGADIAAQRGERVDLPILQQEEGEGLVGLVTVGGQRLPDACSQSSSKGSSST